jgi:hypothetical protein
MAKASRSGDRKLIVPLPKADGRTGQAAGSVKQAADKVKAAFRH